MLNSGGNSNPSCMSVLVLVIQLAPNSKKKKSSSKAQLICFLFGWLIPSEGARTAAASTPMIPRARLSCLMRRAAHAVESKAVSPRAHALVWAALRGCFHILNAPHINNRPLKTSLSHAQLKLNRRVGRQRQPVFFLPCERQISTHRGACIN
jgi:hypothetical protein